MPINIGANFAYNGKLPNFERDSFDTKAAMKAFDENSIDEGHLSYCKEDGNIYQYKHTNTVDATTGKWRLFKTEADAILNGTSTNPIQNKAVFEALKTKADAVDLAAYQPKYNADYVATSDFDYSELPNDVEIVDLNGYTMMVSTDNIFILHKGYHNGSIYINSNQVELTGVFYNVHISSNDEFEQCKTGDGCNYMNCTLTNMLITADCELHNCTINSSVIETAYYIGFSELNGCTFAASFNDDCIILNSIINGVTYHTAVIKNGKPTEAGFESDITNSTIPGNAPSCEAVKGALQLKADKTSLAGYQPKYKADYVATKDFNYSELPNNVNVIDLNGYTMIIDDSGVGTFATSCRNGNIQIKVNGVEIDGCTITNTDISTNSNITFDITEPVFYNCNISGAAIADPAAEFNNCELFNCTFDTVPVMNNCVIRSPKITAGTVNDVGSICNVIINGVPYKKAVIENNQFVEAGYETSIDVSSNRNNAVSRIAIVSKFQQYLTRDDAVTTYVTKDSLNNEVNQLVEEINLKLDDTVAASTYLRKDDANTTYAKKSDITNIYKFKGTKTNYADLPTTGVVTGDVWNITNADAEHGIKAGDNVAWNGTAWDNLSGTVDLSAYATTSTTDAMSADIKKLMNKAFPFTVNVSIDKTLAKKGTSQPVKVTITPKIGDDNTNVDTILINGAEHHGAIPYVYSDTATTTTTYNVRADKDGRTAQGSATITFVNPSYDGAVAANFTATEANIKALTETLRSGKGGERTFNLNNQKACIAYPKDFKAASFIKDVNGFDYLASYTRSELNVNGELYYVYLLTNAATITDFKQTIS